MTRSNSSQPGDDPSSRLKRCTEQAAAGDSVAQRELGRLYLLGFAQYEGLPLEASPHAEEAERFLGLSSEQGDAEATLLLGQLFDGPASDVSYDEPWTAYRHYERAVDLGCRSARFFVASAKLLGRGTQHDEAGGVEMMMEAAYAGDTTAQVFLSKICERYGDKISSHAWLFIAHHLGSNWVDDLRASETQCETPERVRVLYDRVRVYSLLVDAFDTVLWSAADAMREAIRQESVDLMR